MVTITLSPYEKITPYVMKKYPEHLVNCTDNK